MTKTGTESEAQIVQRAKESTTTTINIQYIQKDVAEIKETLKTMSEVFVTQTEFKPIKSILFGLVGTILLAFLGAIISLVINR